MKRRIGIFLWLTAFIFVMGAKQASATQALPEKFEAVYEEILKDPNYLSLGNPEGEYVIIDFFDYRCDFCKKLHKELYELVHSKNGKNIRWISIEAPVFGYKYNYASDIVLASKKHGLYNQVFDKVAQSGTVTQSEIYGYFKELGGDVQQLKKDVAEMSFIPVYRKHFDIYRIFNTTAVPILIINKKYQIGTLKEGQMEQIIKEANPPRIWETIFLRFF